AEGPGAARYVDGIRETNHRSTTTYLKRLFAGRSPVAERERLDDRRRAGETLVLGLRTIDGVDREGFLRRTGFTLDEVAGPAVNRFVKMGLLADDQSGVRLTRDGLLVSDSLWPDLL
ncbi:MAG: coproporphyrinogen III oxidase family protein, partial [Planctomycetota bacterium]